MQMRINCQRPRKFAAQACPTLRYTEALTYDRGNPINNLLRKNALIKQLTPWLALLNCIIPKADK